MFDSAELIVAGTGNLYVAPEGTPIPSHLSETPNAAFVDLGYSTEDGVKFTDGKTVNRIRPWQSFYPARVHVTAREGMFETTLMQWNPDTMVAAFGGGGIIEPQPGEYRYEPPAPETLAVVALVIDLFDGTRSFRFCTSRAFVTSNVESSFTKSGPALLPITFEILAADAGGNPWTLDSDDPAWEPIS